MRGSITAFRDSARRRRKAGGGSRCGAGLAASLRILASPAAAAPRVEAGRPARRSLAERKQRESTRRTTARLSPPRPSTGYGCVGVSGFAGSPGSPASTRRRGRLECRVYLQDLNSDVYALSSQMGSSLAPPLRTSGRWAERGRGGERRRLRQHRYERLRALRTDGSRALADAAHRAQQPRHDRAARRERARLHELDRPVSRGPGHALRPRRRSRKLELRLLARGSQRTSNPNAHFAPASGRSQRFPSVPSGGRARSEIRIDLRSNFTEVAPANREGGAQAPAQTGANRYRRQQLPSRDPTHPRRRV